MRIPHVLVLLTTLTPLATAGDVFSYPPSPTGGLLSSSWVSPDGSDSDVYAYNDFTLADSEAITEVRWRGGYAYGAQYGKVFHFTITFFATNITGFEPLIVTLPDPEGSEPALARYQVNGNAGESPAGSIGGVAYYDYRYVLPTPFNATGGVKYWIRVDGWQPTYPDWGMIRGTGGNGSHFHFSTGSSMFHNYPGDTSFTLAAAWKDLGFAKAGSKGLPALVGTGSLTSNTTGTLSLSNAKANATAFGIVGATAIHAPFLGGTLVPSPTFVFALPTGSAGKIALPFMVPANTPPGISIHAQYWISDPAATAGYAASNALLGVTY